MLSISRPLVHQFNFIKTIIKRDIFTYKPSLLYLGSSFRCLPRNITQRNYSDTATVRDEGNRLELRAPRWYHPIRYSYVWLRDHCRCRECYNYDTQQRRHDVHTIPLNIVPLSIKTTEDELNVEWPDGHTSTYSYKFLWQSSYEGLKTSTKYPQCLWTANSFPDADSISTPLASLDAANGLKKLVESIVKYGVGFITEVPPNIDATRSAIEKVCDVKKTFYGEMWSFSADNMEHADTAYTNETLGAHTDTTYFPQASRIQIFHCLKPAAEGGDTLLVDGFSVADQLKKKHPKSYKFFSNTAIPSHYLGDEQHHLSLDYVFKHHPNSNRLKQFRYNIYDRAPLSSIPYEHIDDFYEHLHNLTSIVRKKSNEHWILLQPGSILFIDNWRIMHGRASFKGHRVMGGCYLDQDDFSSKARVLGVNVD